MREARFNRTVMWLAAISAAAHGGVALAQPAPATPPVNNCSAKPGTRHVFVTGDCIDSELDKPYVDARRNGKFTDPRSGITIEYLYIHGGFTGTNAKFAFYFPDKSAYKGRFFQTTYPMLGTEDAAENCVQVGTSVCSVVFALANGAYVVSTNNAGGVQSGSPLAAFRTNAAAAKYSRVVAREVYGVAERPRGYIYGASGGAYQTVGALENTEGVWDGGVPMVFGVPNAIPSFMSVQSLALRRLREKLPQIADAVAPGGSGDPYAGLTPEEAGVLKEATRLGMPLRGWWQYQRLSKQPNPGFGMFAMMDPGYLSDFWSKPGYEGKDPAVQAMRVRLDTTVAGLEGATVIKLADAPPADLAQIAVTSGSLSGKSLPVQKVAGNSIIVATNAGMKPGDTIRIDNSNDIAFMYFHRHQPVDPTEYGFAQFRDGNGKPLYAQRPFAVGPMMNAGTAGSPASGSFHGKMIMLESAMDVMAYPWSADWYRQRAVALQGDKVADRFRLWYADNADHGPDLSSLESGVGFEQFKGANYWIVGYIGAAEQALLALDRWVVDGTPPPANSGYRIDEDNQVRLAETASARRGVQPLVTLRGSGSVSDAGSERVEIPAGASARFTVHAEVPPQAGKIVKVEWAFNDTDPFRAGRVAGKPAARLRQTLSHTFDKAGTYYATVRVTSQRDEAMGTPFGQVQNIAKVRLVVK